MDRDPAILDGAGRVTCSSRVAAPISSMVRRTARLVEWFSSAEIDASPRYAEIRGAVLTGRSPAPYAGWRVVGSEHEFDGESVTVTLLVQEPSGEDTVIAAALAVLRASGIDPAGYTVVDWPFPRQDHALFPLVDEDGRFIGSEEVRLQPAQYAGPRLDVGWSEHRKVIYFRLLSKD